jgi:hypothetical protein
MFRTYREHGRPKSTIYGWRIAALETRKRFNWLNRVLKAKKNCAYSFALPQCRTLCLPRSDTPSM